MMTLFKVLVVIGILVIVFNIGRCYGLDEARKIIHEELAERREQCEEDS